MTTLRPLLNTISSPDAHLIKTVEKRTFVSGVMDNRYDLIVDSRVTQAVGIMQHDAAKAMPDDRPAAYSKTIGADKNHDIR